jgi:hypothetical protein
MSIFGGMYGGGGGGGCVSGSLSVDARNEARRADTRSRDVEQRLEKLTLICMAMWSLIQQETKLTEEDLLERARQIDLLDGTVDGRVTPQIARCAACSRVMNPRHSKCLYCGQEKLVLSAFDEML